MDIIDIFFLLLKLKIPPVKKIKIEKNIKKIFNNSIIIFLRNSNFHIDQ